ncbi:MAG: carbohydrate kinase family protein [Chloroflexi bacterium]|nr:carbohydrate kinase family protein [Chloroflexota bacterium]
MSRILVAGLINHEITLQVDAFPVPYYPVRYAFHAVNSTISGVGFNIAKALTTLDDDVSFLSILGRDTAADLTDLACQQVGLPQAGLLRLMDQTAHSVIIYDAEGRRQINVDLKTIQETPYPAEPFEAALAQSDLAVLCNINFTRPYLKQARQLGVPIATDVHTISDINDEYNSDYMRAATILFQSDENLPCPPTDWIRRVQNHYETAITVVGLGAGGALIGVREDGYLEHMPAHVTRPIRNTIGAGDALFSAFVHSYLANGDPYLALRKATIFASWKIGEAGAAEGFLSPAALDELYQSLH